MKLNKINYFFGLNLIISNLILVVFFFFIVIFGILLFYRNFIFLLFYCIGGWQGVTIAGQIARLL